MSTSKSESTTPSQKPTKLWVRILIAAVSAVLGALGYGSII